MLYFPRQSLRITWLLINPKNISKSYIQYIIYIYICIHIYIQYIISAHDNEKSSITSINKIIIKQYAFYNSLKRLISRYVITRIYAV